jgi:transposase
MREVLTLRWTVLVDVARQELADFQATDFDSLSTTAETLKAITASIVRISEVIPEVSSES